jgi:glycosyltransferase involved in cell wall biosynthesis
MNSLSIIIPAYNEEKTIIKVLESIRDSKFDNTKVKYQIIVVNDGSKDKTLDLLENNKSLYDVLINNPTNMGKGFSVREALKISICEYIIFQDADLEYNPEDYKKFFLLSSKFSPDLIIGSRFNYDKYVRSHNYLNRLGNLIITKFFNILFNTTFNDIYSCYVCFKNKIIKPEDLKTYGFEQQAEILWKIVTTTKVFFEVPINYNGRSAAEGKKIKFYHLFLVLAEIIKGRILSLRKK